jgi:hypothetical protein
MWPVGPEPPGVYWRRRLIVLGVLVLVIIFLWWLFVGRSSGSPDAGPTPEPTPTDSPTATPSPTTASPTPTRTDGSCADEDILVEATPELAIYPVGSTPQLTLTITNIGVNECRRDVGPGANEIAIESGEDVLWSSDDCNPSDESDVVALARGESFETQVVWDGRTSEEGCPPDMPLVEAGEYSVIGRNGALVSPPSALRME